MAEGSCVIHLKRFHPYRDPSYYTHSFEVPLRERSTVLEALIYIYENTDSTLAFSFSCRYERCGLCAVMVDGRPALACVTLLEDGQEIAPLRNLPLLKDLVVLREPLEALIQVERIFPVDGEGRPYEGGTQNTGAVNFPVLKFDPYLDKLLGCMECLCCHASCPVLAEEGLEEFAGPYIFVKMAQLHYDPRDTVDRAAQAKRLGVEKCRSCGRCTCPQGIEIYEKAILPFLEGRE